MLRHSFEPLEGSNILCKEGEIRGKREKLDLGSTKTYLQYLDANNPVKNALQCIDISTRNITVKTYCYKNGLNMDIWASK